MLFKFYQFMLICYFYVFGDAFGKPLPLNVTDVYGITEAEYDKTVKLLKKLNHQVSKTDVNSLFLDDLLLDTTHLESIVHYDETIKKDSRGKRQAGRKKPCRFLTRKWDLPIKYKWIYEDDTLIKSAISHIEEHTCIHFQKLPSERPEDDDHIVFDSSNNGCGTKVGRQGGRHVIQIGRCRKLMGNLVHEILHVLGVVHEQNRSDKQKHVKVFEHNVKGGSEVSVRSFPQDKLVTEGLPYDFNSLMHYNKYMLCKDKNNCRPTILPRDNLYEKNIGQLTGLSFYDKKLLNLIYCKEKCRGKLPCKKAGFRNPNNCSECICHDGLGGSRCTQAAPSHRGCFPNTDKIIWVTDEKESCFESPNYGTGGYKPMMECNWYLKAKRGRVMLYFSGNFSVFCERSTETCFHWVEIKYKNRLRTPGPRFCCYNKPAVSLISANKGVVISFRSNFDDETLQYLHMGGFKLCYKLHAKTVKVPKVSPNIRKYEANETVHPSVFGTHCVIALT